MLKVMICVCVVLFLGVSQYQLSSSVDLLLKRHLQAQQDKRQEQWSVQKELLAERRRQQEEQYQQLVQRQRILIQKKDQENPQYSQELINHQLGLHTGNGGLGKKEQQLQLQLESYNYPFPREDHDQEQKESDLQKADQEQKSDHQTPDHQTEKEQKSDPQTPDHQTGKEQPDIHQSDGKPPQQQPPTAQDHQTESASSLQHRLLGLQPKNPQHAHVLQLLKDREQGQEQHTTDANVDTNSEQLNHPQPQPQQHTNRRQLEDKDSPPSLPKGNRQQLSIPFWEQQLVFQARSSWRLMVAILADDCMPGYKQHDKQHSNQNNNQTEPKHFPTLLTLQDALTTNHANHVMVYFPQSPTSTLFPNLSSGMQLNHKHCQAKLLAMIHSQFQTQLDQNQLTLIHGIVNPLPPRIAYDYLHRLPADFKQLDNMGLPAAQVPPNREKIKRRRSIAQLVLEQGYSLGLDFAYIAEYAYQHKDHLLFFLKAGTRLHPHIRTQQQQQQQSSSNVIDYGSALVQQYENFQQRLEHDHLVHRFCYMSFLQEDTLQKAPPRNATASKDSNLPKRYQEQLELPTGILLERHGLYRMSMILRSLLPYHKSSTSGLLHRYCNDLLWEAQILQPVGQNNYYFAMQNVTAVMEEATFPPPLFVDKDDTQPLASSNTQQQELPTYTDEQYHQQLKQQKARVKQGSSIPEWVTVDNRQLGPQRDTHPSDLMQLPRNYTPPSFATRRKKITFLVPTSTRPNGIKNQYVTASLNQLFPLIRRDLRHPDTNELQALVLLVICGNTQDELDDHQDGLWEYYGPEIREGILEIVSTNLETYPSLHDLPNNYNDNEARLRWRSKQNLDISSSFFAAKGKSDYIMLLEDDTGYRDKFTATVRALLQADERQEGGLIPDEKATSVPTPVDDFRQHVFSQVHFGFGYSGVLIHDDDALVYAVVHYVLMDEKPCDLIYLANHLQGQVLDQKWRWQMKRVLLTHLGSVSSLKGKYQPVWGLKG